MQAEANTLAHARAAVANRLRRGESVPGFGHPLYPEGDPPATELIRLAEASRNEGERRAVRNLAKAGAELLQDLPSLDFGLAAVTRTYRLPDGAPKLLFALGRTVGWIAHAIEEYARGQSSARALYRADARNLERKARPGPQRKAAFG